MMEYKKYLDTSSVKYSVMLGGIDFEKITLKKITTMDPTIHTKIMMKMTLCFHH